MSNKTKEIIDAYICHGLDLPPGATEGNHECDCPFCECTGHFFVNATDGRYSCKKCDAEGNLWTFMAKYSDMMFLRTPPDLYAELSKKRGIPGKVFKRYKLSWDGEQWLMPVYSEKGTVRDIRRWAGEGVWSTAYCKLQLYGMYELAHSTSAQRVWVCEGEWDTMAMRWLLDNSGHKMDIVVGLPGAKSFKDDWIPYFGGRDVVLCLDNDDPGDRGMEKMEMKVKGTVKRLNFINWPETLAPGYDIRDLVKDSIAEGTPMREVMQVVESLLKPHRRREQIEDGVEATPGGPPEEPITFAEVVTAFKKWIKLDKDFEDGIAICLAISLANEVAGDPIWLYLIGPAGSGKTVILMSLNTSVRTAFYSSLTPASLISGFNVHPDPSLLPQLDRKCAIFKDGTELLAMHPEARAAVYGTLRGAYDGSVYKRFGNGVIRDYKDLRFNMIIGITPSIHGDNQAAMGERFLKYEMREHAPTINDKLLRAMDNVTKEVKMGEELSEAARRFLHKNVDPDALPTIGMNFLQKIAALAQLVALLRAQVDRDGYGDRDVKFRPVHETGTRVAKQLAKLGRMLCHVYDCAELDARIYRMLRRVAMDTCTGYHVDIVRSMMASGNVGMTRDQIADAAKISRTNMYRRLEDLDQLGIIRKEDGTVRVRAVGTIPVNWFISDEVAALWDAAWLRMEGDAPVVPPPPPKRAAEAPKPAPKGSPAPSGGVAWGAKAPMRAIPAKSSVAAAKSGRR